jgi:hypothetical protein
LKEIEKQLLAKNNPDQKQISLIRETMEKIESDRNPPELRRVEG